MTPGAPAQNRHIRAASAPTSAMSQSVYPFSLGEFTMQIKLTAVFQKVPEGYIGFVEELPGANTQGDTLEEARSNLEEAVQLVLEANRELKE